MALRLLWFASPEADEKVVLFLWLITRPAAKSETAKHTGRREQRGSITAVAGAQALTRAPSLHLEVLYGQELPLTAQRS